MKTFYCIIKYRHKDGFWMDLIKDNIQAENKKDAREKVKNEFKIDAPMRIALKDVKDGDLLLKLYEHDGKYFTHDFFDEKECKVCGKKFNICEKYNLTGGFGSYDICSEKCETKAYEHSRKEYDNYFSSNPVIYKITKISTGQVYIGQTIRIFVWRWHDHIKSKEFIINDITDISFQVIESLPVDSERGFILERETYWMKHYNSIENGFNKVISKKDINP